jgi:flagellar protein FlbD
VIQVTRLNGTKHYINALFIEDIEATPDTVLTLTNGKKLVAKESVAEVLRLIKDFYRDINAIKVVTMPNAEDSGEES